MGLEPGLRIVAGQAAEEAEGGSGEGHAAGSPSQDKRPLTKAQACVVTGRLQRADQARAVQALATFASRCDLVSVTEEVLARAGRPFPIEPIRPLDAIHLATAELLGEPPAVVTILTRDDRIRDNAKALGYAIA
ncbi:MAG TPA: PIN domain-containing protein [Gemmatimonadales bacterium]|nr:PIN domain-containing protein [Gemmatimonadales bacterium]